MKPAWSLTAVLAVGALALASSQPYFTLYRPWAWTSERTLEAGAAGEFSLPMPEAAGAAHAASVEVVGFQMLDDEQEQRIGIHAPEGFETWLVMTQWSAPADAVLVRCRMWATGSDGREYHLTDGIFGDAGMIADLSQSSACTPPAEQGPAYDALESKVMPGTPRPESWRKITPVAMPAGVQPAELHLGWEEPRYVTLVLPEPAEFVDSPPPAPA
ncbi:hypothetical protein M5J20_06720 [Corynebacterium sp. TA-R-1]|uniref:Uncharacterized protein n=1 Tax=Corynebacterium stercoris TaxID=2943490 RepID=A0ABT1G488_9CORY|nr:hypothetical protein [Corynebacterium stercoris]MCP1387883.1 hypothetical protein [Corynebacterium stercoris]